MSDRFEELANIFKSDKLANLDYDKFMSYIPDSIKNRYQFTSNISPIDNKLTMSISDLSSGYHITIPLDNVHSIEERGAVIEVYVLGKYVLNIWKNTHLLTIQIF